MRLTSPQTQATGLFQGSCYRSAPAARSILSFSCLMLSQDSSPWVRKQPLSCGSHYGLRMDAWIKNTGFEVCQSLHDFLVLFPFYLLKFKKFFQMKGATVFFFFLKILFSSFSPQNPPVHSCVFFVVGPSSCGMWDAASTWFDEQCHVCAQDSNQWNTGLPAAEHTNLTTRPWGQPRKNLFS